MKRYVQIAAIIAGVVVIVIVLAALILPRVLNPNQYKDRIISLVKTETGLNLKIPGNISMSVFPWLGVKIGEMELGNAPGFQAPDLARVKQVQIRVKLLPLLSKKVEADVITVRGLTLNLERNKDGQTNWNDLIKKSPAAPSGKPAAAPASPPAVAALAVGGLDIRDSTVTWTDHRSGVHMILKKILLNTSEINLVDPVTVKIDFDLNAEPAGISASVDAGARIGLDLKGQRYTLDDLALKAQLSGKAIPGGRMKATAGGVATFDGRTGKLDLTGLKVKTSGLTVAPYNIDALIEASGAGDLRANRFDLSPLKTTLTLTGGQSRVVASLTGDVRADLKARKVAVSGLALTLPEAATRGVQAKFVAPRAGSAQIDLGNGTFSVDGLSLDGTLSGEKIPGKSMPIDLSLKLLGNLDKQTITVEPKLNVAGIKSVTNLTIVRKSGKPEIQGTLTVASLNPRDVFARLSHPLPITSDPKAFSVAQGSASFLAGPDALKINQLSVKLDDSRITGSAAVTHFEAPDVHFDLALDRIVPQRYLSAQKAGTPHFLTNVTVKGSLTADSGFKVIRVAQFSAAGQLDGKIPLQVSAAQTEINLHDQALSSAALKLNAGDMSLQAKVKGTGSSSKPSFTAQLRAPAFNLRKLLSGFISLPETSDPKALSKVALDASVSGSSDGITVPTLNLRIDDSRIVGKADVKLKPAIAYGFDLHLDQIDADRYLPPPMAGKSRNQVAAPAATPGAAASELPVKLLRGLDLDGKLAVGKLKVANLRLTDIRLQAKAKDDQLTLYPLSAKLYGGTYTGNILVDAHGQVPRLKINEHLAKVQAGDLLQDLKGQAMITGTADADFKLTGTGADAPSVLRTLDGNVVFRFSNGRIKGMDLAGRLCQTLSALGTGSLNAQNLVGAALQLFTQEPAGTAKTADSTAFSEMDGSMVFVNGVGTNKDLVLKSPLLRVRGSGSLDLPRNYLNYQATVFLVKSCKGQGGKSFQKLANYPIPVTISGPLDHLDVKPNLTAGLLQVLGGGNTNPVAVQPSAGGTVKSQPAPSAPASPQNAVKGLLQNLLNQ